MQALKIILTSVCAAVLYGILHDQVTARICLEYFTVGHARLIDSDSPTVLGLFWGVVATWWVGLPLGLGLAFAARAGRRPALSAAELIRPISLLLLCMACLAVMGGGIGYFTASAGIFHLTEPLASRVPADKHIAFLTAGWAHGFSYLSGIVGGVVLLGKTWRIRTVTSQG